jgi:hypothetical protein
MADHSKRNWQRAMHDRADQVVGAMLAETRPPAMSAEEFLAQQLRAAYVTGYRDGRDSMKSREGPQ